MSSDAVGAAVMVFSLVLCCCLILTGVAIGVLSVSLTPPLAQTLSFVSGLLLGIAAAELHGLRRRK